MNLYKIPASITLAQGILESGNGISELAIKSNNHFGIKCHSDWEGGRTYHDDDKKGECFRVYDHPRDSYEDHSKFLLRERYAELFDLDIEDYKGWAKGLKKCGYATNPKYSNLLITLIERHDLNRLDSEDADDVATARVNKIDDVKEHAEISHNRPSQYIGVQSQRRDVRTTNHGIQFIIARNGDSPKSLSHDLEMMAWQFRRYNEVAKGYVFTDGEIVYLQPKKNYATYSWHVVCSGQSIWEISQIYGIKTSALLRKNNLEKGESLRTGLRLSLKWSLTNEGKLPWYAKIIGSGKN
jgi:LysM repeat protein